MELKPRFLSVVVLLLFLTLMIIFGMKDEMDSKVQESEINVENTGVVEWLNAFIAKDYTTCDSMLQDKSDALYSTYVLNALNDESYYNMTLDKLVDVIEKVQLESIVRNVDTGITTYTIEVTFKNYKVISDLVYDEHSLDSAKENYYNGDITGAEFQEELSRVYYEIFCNNCFQLDSDTDTRKKDLVLSEKEINGVTCVFGTVSFVDSLLSDSNVTTNLAIYEKDVKEKVNNIIKAY
jgi:hypothetical protein